LPKEEGISGKKFWGSLTEAAAEKNPSNVSLQAKKGVEEEREAVFALGSKRKSESLKKRKQG